MLAIHEGKTSREIRSSIPLSRYSYDYASNRLRNYQLLDGHGEVLIISRKGMNVVNFLKENEKVPMDSVISYAREHNVL